MRKLGRALNKQAADFATKLPINLKRYIPKRMSSTIKRVLGEYPLDYYIHTNKVPPMERIHYAIELTNTCNLRCIQCTYQGGHANGYTRKTGFMKFELYQKAIDEISNSGYAGLLHNADGEATLHPKFLDFMEYAFSKNIKAMHFNTNGLLWNKAFTDRLVDFYCGSVNFSFDGFKQSHERIRQGSHYETVFENLMYLLESNSRQKNRIQIGVSYCNYDQPLGEREKFIEFWKGKVDRITVCETYDIDTKVISSPAMEADTRRRICQIPWSSLEIGFNGDILPCSTLVSKATSDFGIMGNVQHNTLKDIWHGQSYQILRHFHKNFKFGETVCQKCERWKCWAGQRQYIDGHYMVVQNPIFTNYIRRCS
jgi:radical SAM protein with 4Fe4S-binding SPASM domain